MINELPRSQASADDRGASGRAPVGRDGRDGRGITHREISWRGAVLRRALPVLTPPRWLDPLLLVLVAGYLLAGLAVAPYTLEESVQQSLTADAGALLTDPQSLLPGGAVSATEESVRLAYGSLTRYATAAGWYATGGRAADVPVDLTATGPAEVRAPDRHRIVASRAGPALISVAGVLVIFVLTRRLLGRAAALVAVLLFGLHPAVVLAGRQAADAGLTMSFGLAAVLVAAGISARLAGGDEPGLGAWTALTVLGGLTLASGPAAVPYLGGALAFGLAGLLGRQLRRRREVLAGSSPDDPRVPRVRGQAGWVAVTALGAVLVWVLVSPALWGWLPERLDTRHDEQAGLVARRLLPDPGPVDGAARLRAGTGVVLDPFLERPETVTDTTEFRSGTTERATRTTEAGSGTTEPASGTLEDEAGPAAYRQSWWSGLPLGERGDDVGGPLVRVLPGPVVGMLSTLLGMILTGAAALGAVALWQISRRQAVAVAGWALTTVGWLVLTPSARPEHLVPLVALACVLASAAVPFVLLTLARMSREAKEAMDVRDSPDSLDFLGTRDPGSHRARP